MRLRSSALRLAACRGIGLLVGLLVAVGAARAQTPSGIGPPPVPPVTAPTGAPRATVEPGAVQLPDGRFQLRVTIALGDTAVRLPHELVVAGTDSVALDDRPLSREQDYRLDARHGTIQFSPDIALFFRGPTADLVVTYRRFPFSPQARYARRSLAPAPVAGDTTGVRLVELVTPGEAAGFDESRLQRSGSLVRGFTVGSNRDLSLSSGFRLQLSGNLTPDLEIAAALTDESVPIQPEGNTQTLQELDKVFIELKTQRLGATLGDLVVRLDGNEFARFSRKLQGAEARAIYPHLQASAVGAVTRGKFASQALTGEEGRQGPYRLQGAEGERNIVVLAGTERVTLDGQPLVRGQTNDYVIDYAAAQVTFSPRRLITSASRITVDFEYADRAYSRSLVAGQAATGWFADRLTFRTTLVQQADDFSQPIESVTGAAADSLRARVIRSGDDPFRAADSLVTVVLPPASGRYVRQNGHFVYVDPAVRQPGGYNVEFSSVGSGRGDYVRPVGLIGEVYYQYVGPGRGDYAPIRPVALPLIHQVGDLQLGGALGDWTLSGELAASRFDPNRLSALDDADNVGTAHLVTLGFAPKMPMSLFGRTLGVLELSARERATGPRFVSLDRSREVEFNRRWGLSTGATAAGAQTSVAELVREGTLRYRPFESLRIDGELGQNRRAAQGFRSTRAATGLTLAADSARARRWLGFFRPGGQYRIERVDSRDTTARLASLWLRQGGLVESGWRGVRFGLRGEGEARYARDPLADTLLAGQSLWYVDAGPRLSAALGKLAFSGDYAVRLDRAILDGAFQDAATARTTRAELRLAPWHDLSGATEVTARHKQFTDRFKALGTILGNPTLGTQPIDSRTTLIRSSVAYAPLRRAVESDVTYEATSEQSARLRRVFVRYRDGDYVWLGPGIGPTTSDSAELFTNRYYDTPIEQVDPRNRYLLQTLPTDQLFPVVDLKTGFRLRLRPERRLAPPGAQDGALGRWTRRVLRVVSTETNVRVEENSKLPELRRIYLLDFSAFQDSANTLRGQTILSQDVGLWESSPEFSLKFRYGQRRGVVQYGQGTERRLALERSVRAQGRFNRKVTYSAMISGNRDRLEAPTEGPRTQDLTSLKLAPELSYRPIQDLELGLGGSLERLADTYRGLRDQLVQLNSQLVRATYSYRARGRVRTEAERTELKLVRSVGTRSYDLLRGNQPGTNLTWRVDLDYRLSTNVTATATYDGRSLGSRPTLHTARAEVRAFF